eukprot:8212401-Alexandrium_andersonii.AAC.1
MVCIYGEGIRSSFAHCIDCSLSHCARPQRSHLEQATHLAFLSSTTRPRMQVALQPAMYCLIHFTRMIDAPGPVRSWMSGFGL